jgi:hypothetical protein
LGDDDIVKVIAFVARVVEKNDLPVDVPSDDYEHPGDRLDDLCASIVESRGALIEAGHKEEIESLFDDYSKKQNEDEEFGIAKLTEDEKRRVHAHLDKIRQIVEKSSLTRRKKNALFERLNRLRQEVDREGTTTDAFFAFGGDLAFVVGQMAESAKPAIHEFKEVLKIVLGRRATTEGVQLPQPDQFPRLPGPSDE